MQRTCLPEGHSGSAALPHLLYLYFSGNSGRTKQAEKTCALRVTPGASEPELRSEKELFGFCGSLILETFLSAGTFQILYASGTAAGTFGTGAQARVTVLDFAADIGLIAVGFATANICIGLMIWGRYSPVRNWPHRRFDVFRIHRWTGYATLGFTLLHPLPLLFSAQPPFRIVDIAVPLWSPQQPLENTIGAGALYLFVLVIITSIYRIEIGRHLWKRFHYLTYVAAACLFLHGILTDPNLNHSPIDPFDGEKVFVEICLLIVVLASSWRLRYSRKRRQTHALARIGRPAPAD